MNTLLLLMVLAGDPANCPMHAQHTAAAAKPAAETEHHHEVDTRGDRVMGFSHEKTKHTFRLLKEGGAIEVRANDAKDAESIALIRSHLQEIAKEFAAGTYAKPENIHGRVPDGVGVMQDLRDEIRFTYEELDRGARVLVQTKNARAREAVHAFMKFQIEDHRTGDPLTVE
jgi:hypothetical protein